MNSTDDSPDIVRIMKSRRLRWAGRPFSSDGRKNEDYIPSCLESRMERETETTLGGQY